jgi:hypothetical protein
MAHRYEKRVGDYNFGSLIRTDCTDEYSQTNSMFGAKSLPLFVQKVVLSLQPTVTRMQFYAIEVSPFSVIS